MKLGKMIPIILMLTVFIMASCTGDEKKTAEQLNAEAMELLLKGKFNKALEKSEKALQKAELQYGQNNIALSEYLQNLAKVYFTKREYDKSEFFFKKAMGITIAQTGPENIEVAKLINNIAGLYYAQGKYDLALKLYEEAKVIMEKNVPPDDPVWETLRNNIERCKAEADVAMEHNQEIAKNYLDVTCSDDKVPQPVKDYAIKSLKENKMTVSDLKPMKQIYMGTKGLVFPYQCNVESEKGVQKAVLLFSTVSSPEDKNKLVFKQSRLVSYDSYAAALENGGITQLQKEISVIFPELFAQKEPEK